MSEQASKKILESMNSKEDVILINYERIASLLFENLDIQDSIWVFDFDGTLIHKGFNSFSPIDNSAKDSLGELAYMKTYMLCLEDARSYDVLDEILTSRGVVLPEELLEKRKHMTFQELKDEQMHYRREYTMIKAVEWKLPMKNFDLTDLYWRPGAKELVTLLLERNIQTLIISSGIGNLIRYAVEDAGFDLSHPCLHIKSNDFFIDEEGCCSGYNPDLITPFSKMHVDYHTCGIQDKKYALQFGDSLGDARMIVDHFSQENILSTGFTNGKEAKNTSFPDVFDVVFTEKNSSFDDFLQILKQE